MALLTEAAPTSPQPARARLPSGGPRRRTVVVVAHHDAAHSGFVWHPAMLAAGRARAAKTGMTPSYSILPMGGMIAVATGWAPLRMLARAVLGAGVALSV